MTGVFIVNWKKKKKERKMHKSCKWSLIWDKMRTIAQETAFQIALRNCSKEVGGKVSVIYDWEVKWRGGMCNQAHFFGSGLLLAWGADVTSNNFSAFLGVGRCKNWAYKIFSWKYLSEDLFSVPQCTKYLIPHLHPEPPSGGDEGLQWFTFQPLES